MKKIIEKIELDLEELVVNGESRPCDADCKKTASWTGPLLENHGGCGVVTYSAWVNPWA